jgi:hypothetical protein
VRRWALVLLAFLPAGLRAQEPTVIVQEPNAAIDWTASAWQGRIFAGAEYLLLWTRDDRPPGPLVTTGPAGDPRQGVLGNPTTGVLYDGSRLDHGVQSGGRFWLWGWFDPEQRWGAEIGGFVMETHTLHGKADSNRTDGSPVIARPFFNTLTGREDAEIITSPQDPLGGRYLGGIDVFSDSRTWGAEANVLLGLGSINSFHCSLLGGFRYLGQNDKLRFSQSSTVLIPGTVGFLGMPAPAPDIVSIKDYFETNNNFYGGQVGAAVDWLWGRLDLNLVGKVGLGATNQNLEVSGHTLLTDPAGSTLFAPGGLHTQAGNIGHFSRDRCSFVSEVGLNLGYQVTPHVLVQTGYTFLFWGDLARPGNQIDRNIDPRQIPSNLAYEAPTQPIKPAFHLESTDFWIQGISFGLILQF